jgi:hypothetical protein
MGHGLLNFNPQHLRHVPSALPLVRSRFSLQVTTSFGSKFKQVLASRLLTCKKANKFTKYDMNLANVHSLVKGTNMKPQLLRKFPSENSIKRQDFFFCFESRLFVFQKKGIILASKIIISVITKKYIFSLWRDCIN